MGCLIQQIVNWTLECAFLVGALDDSDAGEAQLAWVLWLAPLPSPAWHRFTLPPQSLGVRMHLDFRIFCIMER